VSEAISCGQHITFDGGFPVTCILTVAAVGVSLLIAGFIAGRRLLRKLESFIGEWL